MAKSTDWLPSSRTAVLAMAHEQVTYLTGERRTAWGAFIFFFDFFDLFDLAVKNSFWLPRAWSVKGEER